MVNKKSLFRVGDEVLLDESLYTRHSIGFNSPYIITDIRRCNSKGDGVCENECPGRVTLDNGKVHANECFGYQNKYALILNKVNNWKTRMEGKNNATHINL
jgi:hypothetical protein